MTQTFKEFLETEKKVIKGNEKEPSWHGQFKEFNGFKKRLGEWALKKHIEWKKDLSGDIEDSIRFEDIAIECLGKKETEKLKEESK